MKSWINNLTNKVRLLLINKFIGGDEMVKVYAILILKGVQKLEDCPKMLIPAIEDMLKILEVAEYY